MAPLDRLALQLVACLKTHLAARQKPIVPEAGRPLWSFFVELSRCRTYHMSGPNPISHQEIVAWALLKRWPLKPHHVDMIVALDVAWLEHAYAKQAMAVGGVKAAPLASSQAVNPGAFDAVFG